jgi:hypothetical protein
MSPVSSDQLLDLCNQVAALSQQIAVVMRRATRSGQEAPHNADIILLTQLVELQKRLLAGMREDESHGECAGMGAETNNMHT